MVMLIIELFSALVPVVELVVNIVLIDKRVNYVF
jgi:hypothetical protein